MRLRSLVAIAFTVVALSCERDKSKSPDELLAEDTTLARDLASATDALDDGYLDTSFIGLTDDDPPPSNRPAPPSGASPASPPAPAATPPAQKRPPRARESAPSPSRVRASTEDSAPGCSSPAGADQKRCLLALLSRYDVELNTTYRQLIQRLRREAGVGAGEADPPSVDRLRAAQRSWLVYRDRECRRRTRSREGELWAPVRARCLGQLSDVRARELATM